MYSRRIISNLSITSPTRYGKVWEECMTNRHLFTQPSRRDRRTRVYLRTIVNNDIYNQFHKTTHQDGGSVQKDNNNNKNINNNKLNNNS